MGVVNSLKTLASMVAREKAFLVSNDNRIAAGALTDRTGAPATEGALYPPGWLHHHVVTRRTAGNSRHGGPRRDGRLIMATYETYVDDGVLRWRPIWKFDLSSAPHDHTRAARGPYRPLPLGDGRLSSLAVALVSATLRVAAGGPSEPDLRMTRALCDPRLNPGESEADGLKRSTAYDSRPVLALALRAANGEIVIPDCTALEDAVVVNVKTGYQDRQEGSTQVRAMVHLRRVADHDPAASDPERIQLAGDRFIELPEHCQLAPELVAVANGETAPGALTIKAGTVFAWPLVPGRRTKWQHAKAELDYDASRWLQYQSVLSATAADRDGLVPAETQQKGSADKLFERAVVGVDMVRACDFSYNPDRKLIDRGGLDGTSAVFDVWSLNSNSNSDSGRQDGNHRDQPGTSDHG